MHHNGQTYLYLRPYLAMEGNTDLVPSQRSSRELPDIALHSQSCHDTVNRALLPKHFPTTTTTENIYWMNWRSTCSEKLQCEQTACLNSVKNQCRLDTYLHSSWCSGRSAPPCRFHSGCRSHLQQRSRIKKILKVSVIDFANATIQTFQLKTKYACLCLSMLILNGRQRHGAHLLLLILFVVLSILDKPLCDVTKGKKVF